MFSSFPTVGGSRAIAQTAILVWGPCLALPSCYFGLGSCPERKGNEGPRTLLGQLRWINISVSHDWFPVNYQ